METEQNTDATKIKINSLQTKVNKIDKELEAVIRKISLIERSLRR